MRGLQKNIEGLLDYLQEEDDNKYLLFYLIIKFGLGTGDISNLKFSDIKFEDETLYVKSMYSGFIKAKIPVKTFIKFRKVVSESAYNNQNILFTTKNGTRLPRSYFKYIIESLRERFNLGIITTLDLKETPLICSEKISENEFNKLEYHSSLASKEDYKLSGADKTSPKYLEDKFPSEKGNIIVELNRLIRHENIVELYKIGEVSILFRLASSLKNLSYYASENGEIMKIAKEYCDLLFFLSKRDLPLVASFPERIFVEKQNNEMRIKVVPRLDPFYLDLKRDEKLDYSIYPIEFHAGGEIDIATDLYSAGKILSNLGINKDDRENLSPFIDALLNRDKSLRVKTVKEFSKESIKYERVYNDPAFNYIYKEITGENCESKNAGIFYLNNEFIDIEDFREFLFYKGIVLFDISPSPILFDWVYNLFSISKISKEAESAKLAEEISKYLDKRWDPKKERLPYSEIYSFFSKIIDLFTILHRELNLLIFFNDYYNLFEIDKSFFKFLLKGYSDVENKSYKNNFNTPLMFTFEQKYLPIFLKEFDFPAKEQEPFKILQVGNYTIPEKSETTNERTRKLSQEAYLILEILTLYNYRIDFESLIILVGRILNLDQKIVVNHLFSLLSSLLVSKKIHNDKIYFSVKYNKVRDLVNSIKSPQKKEKYHADIIEFMQETGQSPELIIYHLLNCNFEKHKLDSCTQLILKTIDRYIALGAIDDANNSLSKIFERTEIGKTNYNLCLRYAMTYLLAGKYLDAFNILSKISATLKDDYLLSDCYSFMGEIKLREGIYGEACEFFDLAENKLLPIHKDDQLIRSLLLRNRVKYADAAIRLHDYKRAKALIATIEKEYDHALLDDPTETPDYLYGLYYLSKHNFERAKQHLTNALKRAERSHSRRDLAKVKESVAISYFESDDFETAERFYKESGRLFRELNDHKNLAINQMNLAILYERKKNIKEAVNHYNRAINILNSLDPSTTLFNAALNLGMLYLRYNKIDSAMVAFQKADKIGRELETQVSLSNLNQFKAELAGKSGDFEESATLFEIAIESYKRAGLKYDLVSSMLGYIDVKILSGNFDLALRTINKASEIIESDNIALFKPYLIIEKLKLNYYGGGRIGEVLEKILDSCPRLFNNSKDSEALWRYLLYRGKCISKTNPGEASQFFRKSREIIFDMAANLPRDLAANYLNDPEKQYLFALSPYDTESLTDHSFPINKILEKTFLAQDLKNLSKDLIEEITSLANIESVCISLDRNLREKIHINRGAIEPFNEKGIDACLKSHLIFTQTIKKVNYAFFPVFFSDQEFGAIIITGNGIRRWTPFVKIISKILAGYIFREIKVEKERSTLFVKRSEEVGLRHRYDEIIGRSDSIVRVLAAIDKISESNISVLVTGETGTGKELIARAIHSTSNRAKKPFIAINCSAIPASLLESEFFGYTKGSFTGAFTDKDGLFKIADEGTLFLDEVGDMPLDMQASLLRVIEQKKIRPIGSSKEFRVDVRIISATNRNLALLIKKGLFREDLYFRLNTIKFEIPPLRERKDDIRDIILFFSKGFVIDENIVTAFKKYNWPGNIRELSNEIEKLKALSCDNILRYELIEDDKRFGA